MAFIETSRRDIEQAGMAAAHCRAAVIDFFGKHPGGSIPFLDHDVRKLLTRRP